MTRRLLDKAAIDAAIAAKEQPRAPKGARGLLLGVPGGRARKLMDAKGALTPAGKYYYSKTEQGAPNRNFDYKQEPQRRGVRVQASLIDGQKVTVRTWDGVRRQWRFTKAGQEYYKDSKDRYVVSFPVKEVHIVDGAVVWEKDTVLQSTATPLGEIALPTLMPDDEQLAEVKRRAQAYIDGLPEEPGLDGKIFKLANQYNVAMLDTSRQIEYNKEHIDIRPDGESTVSAVLHRPLRGEILDFGFAGVCPEAYQDSGNRCVQKQLEALTRCQHLERDMDDIFQELYGKDHDDNPYVIETEDGAIERQGWREAGITCAMVHAFAVRHSLPVHILWNKNKILSYRPQTADGSSLCLYVFGDHAFFISDPHTKSVLARMKTSKPEPSPEAVLAILHKSDVPPASEWRHWTGQEQEPGHYYTYDLGHARLEMHTQGKCPKVALNGAGVPKALHLKMGSEKAVVHTLPKESTLCEAFAEELEKRTKRKVVYKGESLATFANNVFTELLKPPKHRKQLSDEQYSTIWNSQGRQCNGCGCKNGVTMNVDHVAPRFVGGGNELENLQLICANCHAQKTMIEALSFVEDEHPLLSRFSIETYEAYVESPKPPQLVANMHERPAGGIGIDVIRCRYNAFVEANHEIPIYAPTDAIVPATPGKLCDNQWIDIGPLGPHQSPASVQPYSGPRWYTRGAAAVLLDWGIATWSDFKWSYHAAVHRPAEFLAERLRLMDENWMAVAESHIGQLCLEGREPRSFVKCASSALFGLWGCREHYLYKMVTTTCADDVLGSAEVSSTPGSMVFKDYVTKQRLLELTSMRPVHQICLEEERTHMARLYVFAQRYCDPKNIYSFRVDELVVKVAKSRVPAFVKAVEALSYADLRSIAPKGRKPALQEPTPSTAQAYKTRFIAEPQPPAGPLQLHEGKAPELPDAIWVTREEPLDGLDNFLDEIVQHVLNGGSAIVEGIAGTGKTVVLRALQRALEEQGHRCQAICLTHTGARNIGPGACTAHSFVMKHVLHGTFGGQVVLVDEISFMSLDLDAALEHLRQKGVRIICFGDYDQLPPVSNRWRGQLVPADVFKNSRLSWLWSGGNRFVLRRCRRSDQAHFDTYCKLKDMPVSEALKIASRTYPPRYGCNWNIVMSNYRRKQLNGEMQAAAAREHSGPKVRVQGEVPFECFVGTKLIGCNSTLKGIVNGAFLLVTAIGEKIRVRDEDMGVESEYTPLQLAKHTKLRWALTLCSVQGRSLKGTIAIHDTGSVHFDKTHLYVALSRATDGSCVHIVS